MVPVVSHESNGAANGGYMNGFEMEDPAQVPYLSTAPPAGMNWQLTLSDKVIAITVRLTRSSLKRSAC